MPYSRPCRRRRIEPRFQHVFGDVLRNGQAIPTPRARSRQSIVVAPTDGLAAILRGALSTQDLVIGINRLAHQVERLLGASLVCPLLYRIARAARSSAHRRLVLCISIYATFSNFGQALIPGMYVAKVCAKNRNIVGVAERFCKSRSRTVPRQRVVVHTLGLGDN